MSRLDEQNSATCAMTPVAPRIYIAPQAVVLGLSFADSIPPNL